MGKIAANPRMQKNLSLTIGTDTFEDHVSSVQWVPSSSTVTWNGGTPEAVFTDQTAPTWTAQVNVVQDWETPGSLCNYLLEHAGEQVVAKYKPDATGTFEITATITLAAPTIGGAVNAFNESSVTMGSTKPVPTVIP